MPAIVVYNRQTSLCLVPKPLLYTKVRLAVGMYFPKATISPFEIKSGGRVQSSQVKSELRN